MKETFRKVPIGKLQRIFLSPRRLFLPFPFTLETLRR